MDEDFLKTGRIKLFKLSRRIKVGRTAIALRNREFSLLEYFMENVGKVLSRTQLLEEVWDRNICCSTNTVDVHVSNLRRKLKKYLGKSPIKTIHCIGYRFDV